MSGVSYIAFLGSLGRKVVLLYKQTTREVFQILLYCILLALTCVYFLGMYGQ